MLYHGTNKFLANKNIKKFENKTFKIVVPDIQVAPVHPFKLPGSLGYGYYTFKDDFELARKFSEKKYGLTKSAILRIDVDKEFSDDHVLDLRDPDKQKLFLEFAHNAKIAETAIKLMNMR